jgi:DNA-binding transcriptional LysR family regulator
MLICKQSCPQVRSAERAQTVDKLRAIGFFCRLVEAKSFVAAAHDLDIAPSVLSRTIAALEADLAVKLLTRTTRRVAVTEAGRRYYGQCKLFVAQMEQAEAVARSGLAETAGLVRVGMHPAIASLFIHHVAAFFDRHPHIQIERSITNRPSDLVEAGLDLVVTIGDLGDSTLTARKLGDSEIVVCASPEYLATFGNPERPQDINGHRVIVPGRRDEASFAHWTFSREDESQTVIVPASLIDRDGTHLTRAAVRSAGLIRVFEVSARADLQQGALVRVLADWSCGAAPIHAILPGRTNAPGKVRAVADFVRSIVRPGR